MGKPGIGEGENFRKVTTGDAIIWLSCEIEPEMSDGAIEIYLTRFLFFKNLAIRGARVK